MRVSLLETALHSQTPLNPNSRLNGVSPTAFLYSLINQPLDGWNHLSNGGGIRAEEAHLEFDFHEAHECRVIQELLPRSGHFCRRRLKVSWPDCDSCVQELLVEYHEHMLESVAFLPKEALIHVSQEVEIADSSVGFNREYARKRYTAVEWKDTTKKSKGGEDTCNSDALTTVSGCGRCLRASRRLS